MDSILTVVNGNDQKLIQTRMGSNDALNALKVVTICPIINDHQPARRR